VEVAEVAEVAVATEVVVLVVEDLAEGAEVEEAQVGVLAPVMVDMVMEGGDVEVIIGEGMEVEDMVDGHGATHITRMV
jgi:hypothetical protein